MGSYNDRISLKFYGHLDSAAAKVPFKFHSDWESLNSSLRDILRLNALPLMNRGHETSNCRILFPLTANEQSFPIVNSILGVLLIYLATNMRRGAQDGWYFKGDHQRFRLSIQMASSSSKKGNTKLSIDTKYKTCKEIHSTFHPALYLPAHNQIILL